jgi:hypothetical protein
LVSAPFFVLSGSCCIVAVTIDDHAVAISSENQKGGCGRLSRVAPADRTARPHSDKSHRSTCSRDGSIGSTLWPLTSNIELHRF